MEDLEKEIDTTSTSEVVETENSQVKTYSQAEVDDLLKKKDESNQKAWNKRWGQEKSKLEMQNAKKDELINLLQDKTKTNNIDELLDLSYKQYKVDRPVNTKDQETLGRADASEILALDEESIKEEANRLSGIANRTPREQAKFMEIGKYLTEQKERAERQQELKENGISEEVYNSSDFQELLKKFNSNTKLSEVYEIYNATRPSQKSKPFSAGSLKDTGKKQESEYYTEDEFNALTREDLKDKRVFDKAMKSRLRFGY